MNNRVLFSSKSDDWSTPDYIYESLNSEFGFTLDPCASAENHKTVKYFSKEIDGLSQSWAGEVVFCNPPYSRSSIRRWVAKCFDEWINNNITIVLLVPSRTDTFWFHQYLLRYCEIRFIRGRLKFGSSNDPAPFPSLIAVFRKR